jgi:cobalt-zinc-cadmium efflux system outer membrane protein
MFLQSALRRALWISMCAVAALGADGCAPNPRSGFARVKDTVDARIGQTVYWDTGTVADRQVHAKVASLLAGTLTADQAVQVTLLNSPDLQATYEDLGIAQADLVQAGLLQNPVISADLRFPGRPHYPFDINVEQEFMQLLLLPLRKSVAEASFEQSRAAVTAAVLRRAADVRVAFYRLQGAEQLIGMRRTVLEAAQVNLDAARRLREAGNTPDLDYGNAQGLVAQARLDVSEAEATAAEARADLGELMGVWGAASATWSVADRLPDPPADAVPLPGLESLAIRQREDLSAARHGLLVAARQAGYANYAALLSGATVGVDVVRDADVATTVGPAISVPIPIFDQGQAVTARLRAQFRQAQAQYAALAIEIRSQVHKAYNRMAVARQRVAYYHDSVLPLRQRILDETQRQYNGMFIGLAGLLLAKQQEIDAGARYVAALRDYWVARAELERAIGGRLTAAPRPSATQPAAPTTAPTPAMPGMGRESMH